MLKKIIFILLFCFIPYLAKAEFIDLLEIPLSDHSIHAYSVDLKEKCSFKGVSGIMVSPFNESRNRNIIVDKLNDVQKAVNLGIENQNITPNFISFNLTGAQNVSFEFILKESSPTKDCELAKFITFDHQRHNVEKVDIVYDEILRPSSVKKIIIKDINDNEVKTIYPSQLEGSLVPYELVLGPAFDIHTNTRLNNTRSFENTHPVVKPMPGFLFRYGPFFLNKDGLGSLIYSSGDLSVLAIGILEGEPYESRGLNERSTALYMGGILKYNLVDFTYYRDFFKERGYNMRLNFAPEFHQFLKWKFAPHFYLQYWDNKYVDYFYGVTPAEMISSGLKTYEGRQTWNYGTKFEFTHYVRNWTYLGSVGMKFYGKEVFTSPTVIRKNEMRIILSVLYKIL